MRTLGDGMPAPGTAKRGSSRRTHSGAKPKEAEATRRHRRGTGRRQETRQPGGRPDRGPGTEKGGSRRSRKKRKLDPPRPPSRRDPKKGGSTPSRKKRKYAPDSPGPNRKKKVTRQRPAEPDAGKRGSNPSADRIGEPGTEKEEAAGRHGAFRRVPAPRPLPTLAGWIRRAIRTRPRRGWPRPASPGETRNWTPSALPCAGRNSAVRRRARS